MEATIYSLRYPSASSLLPPARRPFFGKSNTVLIKAMASRRSDPYNHDFNGKLVDESMIVLRRRIREVNRAEKSYEPPRNWTEWEKEYKREKYDGEFANEADGDEAWGCFGNGSSSSV